jgi:DNA-binding GntR family transcriptional regulator
MTSPESPEDPVVEAPSADEKRYGPLVAKMIDDIGREIVEGRLAPGSLLSSADLARRFATSRTPVREALAALEQEGLVEIRLRQQALVASPTPQQVRDAYEVRRQLYVLMAQLIVRNATDGDIDRMWAYYRRLEAAAERGDVSEYFWNNVAFRRYEAVICGNSYLKKSLNALGLHTVESRRASLAHPGRLSRSLADHERLVRAYVDRDEVVAVAMTHALVSEGQRAVMEQLRVAATGNADPAGSGQPESDFVSRGGRRPASTNSGTAEESDFPVPPAGSDLWSLTQR